MIAPPRLPTWEPRLATLLTAVAERPFAWGEHDCALFGAAVIQALTGADFGAPYRGTYRDAAGAAAALREHGAGTITRTFDLHLARCPVGLLRRGDIVMTGSGRAGAIGVVMGADGLFVGARGGAAGLVRVGRASWSRGWRV